jgi:hypothetical protein
VKRVSAYIKHMFNENYAILVKNQEAKKLNLKRLINSNKG